MHKNFLILKSIPWIGIILFVIGVNRIDAQDGEALYKTNCAACHNIEGTPLMGPNLKNITQTRQKDWLKQFITNSRQMYDKGDPEARKIIDQYKGMMMPAFSFSDQQLALILTYIDSQSGTETASAPADTLIEKKDTVVVLKDERYNINRGYDLFTGNISFRNRGSACISCHNVTFDGFSRGGTLARDLTHVYTRINKNEAALRSIITSMPFPAMSEAYKQHPLTDEEVAYLILFLKHTDNAPMQAAGSYGLFTTGLIVMCLMIILLTILYKRGKIRSVNFHILARQQRKKE